MNQRDCRNGCTASCDASFIADYKTIKSASLESASSRPNLCPKKNRLFRTCPASTLCDMHPVTPAGVLAGRGDELALLDGYLRDLARGGGNAVLIEGEPGIGKSALVRTALARSPSGSCHVFWGAGDELGQELPLLPFLDALGVRRPSANARRAPIAGLLRGEGGTHRRAAGRARA